jgi:SAM-dependent methyltransferase
VAPQCRFCNAPSSEQSIKGRNVYGGKPEQHFWLCGRCGMIYLDPPLSEEEEGQFYNQEFEKFMAKRAGKDMDWTGADKHVQSNQREVARRMPLLLKHLKPGQRILEVGCSSGFMLSALKDKGMDVTGLDPSGGFIDYVRGKGIAVFQTLEELKRSGCAPFDAVIHYYVLEHIRHPEKFVRDYLGLTNPGGKMIFEVPCATDPLVELYQVPAFGDFYWSVAHHWYFTAESLAKVLGKTGFAFELYPDQRYDLSNHMTWMLNAKPGGLGRWSEVFGEALDRQYKERLKELWLCDTIAAVVRR